MYDHDVSKLTSWFLCYAYTFPRPFYTCKRQCPPAGRDPCLPTPRSHKSLYAVSVLQTLSPATLGSRCHGGESSRLVAAFTLDRTRWYRRRSSHVAVSTVGLDTARVVYNGQRRHKKAVYLFRACRERRERIIHNIVYSVQQHQWRQLNRRDGHSSALYRLLIQRSVNERPTHCRWFSMCVSAIVATSSLSCGNVIIVRLSEFLTVGHRDQLLRELLLSVWRLILWPRCGSLSVHQSEMAAEADRKTTER